MHAYIHTYKLIFRIYIYMCECVCKLLKKLFEKYIAEYPNQFSHKNKQFLRKTTNSMGCFLISCFCDNPVLLSTLDSARDGLYQQEPKILFGAYKNLQHFNPVFKCNYEIILCTYVSNINFIFCGKNKHIHTHLCTNIQ